MIELGDGTVDVTLGRGRDADLAQATGPERRDDPDARVGQPNLVERGEGVEVVLAHDRFEGERQADRTLEQGRLHVDRVLRLLGGDGRVHLGLGDLAEADGDLLGLERPDDRADLLAQRKSVEHQVGHALEGMADERDPGGSQAAGHGGRGDGFADLALALRVVQPRGDHRRSRDRSG